MRGSMKVYCATGNPGKLQEFRLAAEIEGVEVEPIPGLSSIESPEETGTTFEENAALKARYYSMRIPGELVFCDDSGLAVDALGGAPGVWSARYAEGGGDEGNNDLLLTNLAAVEVRTARYVAVIALARDGEVLASFRGEVEGAITRERRGTNGFGYDPLFYHPPFGCTFGEASAEQKHGVSHRANAFRALLRYLRERRDA
jgi:XTP/dITP diphosphohydrolase